MPTEMHFMDGSAWRKATEVHFHDGSVWRKAQEVFVHDGTAWRKVLSSGAVVNPVDYIQAAGAGAYGSSGASGIITVSPDGTMSASGLGVSGYTLNWFSPTTTGIGSSYWIMATLNNGVTPSGPALGSWHSLSTAQEWSVSRGPTDAGVTNSVLNISIATDSGGTNIVASGTACFDLSAEVYI